MIWNVSPLYGKSSLCTYSCQTLLLYFCVLVFVYFFCSLFSNLLQWKYQVWPLSLFNEIDFHLSLGSFPEKSSSPIWNSNRLETQLRFFWCVCLYPVLQIIPVHHWNTWNTKCQSSVMCSMQFKFLDSHSLFQEIHSSLRKHPFWSNPLKSSSVH